jgi:hypothetical protein
MLMSVYRSTFDNNQPLLKRPIKSYGDALDTILDSVKRVYPGMWANALEIPPRVRVPLGAHPFPGKVN